MNALVRAVCEGASSPRVWRRSLRSQRLVLRTAMLRSPIATVGARFRGAILGEELIDTLSERLARSLQQWSAPAPENIPRTTLAHRTTAAPNVELDQPRTLASAGAPAVQSRADADRAPHARIAKREWGRDNGASTAPSPARPTGEPDAHRALVDAVMAARGAEILRAVRLDAHDSGPRHATRRMSPLDRALQRYWRTQNQPPADSAATSGASPAAVVRSPGEVARVAAVTNGDRVVRQAGTAGEEPDTRRDLNAGQSIAPSLDARARGWWSARVDAIHSRSESAVSLPARAGAPRFEDDLPDESAFADTLAEVLHRQARAYGVAVP